MSEQVRSILIGTSGLSVALVVAGLLTILRGGVHPDRIDVRAGLRLYAIAILAQALHFTEELVTGFAQRFPQLLGLMPWSTAFFVAFNVTWLVIWIASVPALAARWQSALVPAWFLGIGCVMNGVAHPLVAVDAGGYFPGLWTSPIVGLAGFVLVRRLIQSTGDRRDDD